MFDDLKEYALIGLVALVAALSVSTFSYRSMFKADAGALKLQNAAIAAQNKEANDKFVLLTKQRDAAQSALNDNLKTLNDHDKAIQKELDAASHAAANTPVRVRLAASDAGSSRFSLVPSGSGAVGFGKGSAQAATGVLAPANQQRLEQSVALIEQMQQAFNDCKK